MPSFPGRSLFPLSLLLLSALPLRPAAPSQLWNLAELGALCNACYQFENGDRHTSIITVQPSTSCAPNDTQVPLRGLTLVADAMHTLEDGNTYHLLASALRITQISREARERGVAIQVAMPSMWHTHPWASTVLLPSLARTGVAVAYRPPGQKFCTKGWSLPVEQRQPFTIENTFLGRALIEENCNMSLLNVPKKHSIDVLLLTASVAGAAAAQEPGYRSDNLDSIAASLAARGVSYEVRWPPADPCGAARMFMNRYKLVVTPQGPHMASMLAMAPGTAVLEVDPGRHLPAFCRLKRGLGNRWVHFISNNEGREFFIFPNCTLHNDTLVVPGCHWTQGPGVESRCVESFWGAKDVTLSPRDRITMVEMVRIMLHGLRWRRRRV